VLRLGEKPQLRRNYNNRVGFFVSFIKIYPIGYRNWKSSISLTFNGTNIILFKPYRYTDVIVIRITINRDRVLYSEEDLDISVSESEEGGVFATKNQSNET